jgi:ubiquinone/menaquinone biosynthesis C-methylase UbiE
MKPLYMLAYGKRDVEELMRFKEAAYSMSPDQYADFYKSLENSVSRRRITDLNKKCTAKIIESIKNSTGEVLDVGCGNGYLLRTLVQSGVNPERLHGIDVATTTQQDPRIKYHTGLLPSLPFPDKQFNTVVCTHVLEHVVDMQSSINELIRIASKTIIIVVPRQRYYRYTLDEHLNFFHSIQPLTYLLGSIPIKSELINGDWFVEARVS